MYRCSPTSNCLQGVEQWKRQNRLFKPFSFTVLPPSPFSPTLTPLDNLFCPHRSFQGAMFTFLARSESQCSEGGPRKRFFFLQEFHSILFLSDVWLGTGELLGGGCTDLLKGTRFIRKSSLCPLVYNTVEMGGSKIKMGADSVEWAVNKHTRRHCLQKVKTFSEIQVSLKWLVLGNSSRIQNDRLRAIHNAEGSPVRPIQEGWGRGRGV